MKQIIINSEELQTRVAVVHDGKLHDFFMERKDRDRLVGSIFKGKIKNLEPSLQAAFVDIGRGKNAFLHYWDMLPATQEMLEDEDENDQPELVDFPFESEVEVHNLENPAGGSEGMESPHRRRHHRSHHRHGQGGAQREGEAPADPEASQPPARKPLGLLPLTDTPKSEKRQPRPQRQGERSRNNGSRQPEKAEVQVPAAAEKPAPKTGLFRRLISKFLPLGGTKEPEAPKPSEPARPAAVSQGKKADNGREKGAKLLPLTDKPKKESEKSADQHHERPAKKPQPPKKARPGVEAIPELFHTEQEIMVQVTKGPIGTKGARVTTNLSIPGRYLVLLPNSSHIGVSRRVEEKAERDRLRKMLKELELPKNMGVICRTVGKGLKIEHFKRDLELLLDSWKHGEELSKEKPGTVCVYQEPDLAERTLRDCLTEDIDEIITDSQETYKRANVLLERYASGTPIKVKLYESPVPVFDKYGISSQIDDIFNRKVNLPSGGYICIDETEALIAIDVNSGKNRTGKDQPETILTTNLEAVQEIARQLRLRNIGGLVVLDLIDMRSKKDQSAVYHELKECLAEDRAHIKTYPISPLGLLEMTRQREDASLESTMYDSCPYCKGRGLIKSATTMSVEIQRRMNEILGRRRNIQQLTITVHPKILERLRTEDRRLMDGMASDFNRKLTFCADRNLHMEEFHITDENGKEF